MAAPALTKGDVLARLDGLEISYDLHEHEPVMTCEAMVRRRAGGGGCCKLERPGSRERGRPPATTTHDPRAPTAFLAPLPPRSPRPQSSALEGVTGSVVKNLLLKVRRAPRVAASAAQRRHEAQSRGIPGGAAPAAGRRAALRTVQACDAGGGGSAASGRRTPFAGSFSRLPGADFLFSQLPWPLLSLRRRHIGGTLCIPFPSLPPSFSPLSVSSCSRVAPTQDKKHRLYLITALEDTPIALGELTRRMGIPKGSLRLAPPELVESELGVKPGSVTPLCVANASAAGVSLMLDERLKEAERLLVHPLTNEATVALPPVGLEAFLKAVGRESSYVVFGIDPVIDAQHPPDLKTFVDAAKPVQVADEHKDPPAASDKKAKKAEKKAKGGSDAGSAPAARAVRGDDVRATVEETVQAVRAALAAAASPDAALESLSLREDIEWLVTRVKNAAYSEGFASGRAVVRGACDDEYKR